MLKLICKDQPESILSGIYDAWARDCPNREIELVLDGQYQREFFAEYRDARDERELAQKVADTVNRKLSPEVWRWVQYALMADASDKAQAIFVFLRCAFGVGKEVLNQYARPEVMRVYELQRMVGRETQHLCGFVRFADTWAGVLVAGLTPRHRQIPLLAPHFADRFPQERFLLYDKKRKEAAVHEPGAGWYLTCTDRIDLLESLIRESEQDIFGELWQAFFRAIAIEQRENPRCQGNLLPRRFRGDMTEFRRTGSLARRDGGGNMRGDARDLAQLQFEWQSLDEEKRVWYDVIGHRKSGG